MTFSVFDRRMMAKALQLARKGLYTTDPNPRVGCVLTQGDQIIGKGWHMRAGEGHAEVNALKDAHEKGGATQGATAYVTLEPCSHFGRTPPCAQALIDARVSRVVAAMQDPNPLVAGQGFRLMREAGIKAESGLLEGDAMALNCGFIKRMKTGLPWVRVKMAMSLDGRTAMASGESQWITGAASRQDVQRLRARSSTILTGAGTMLHDNPSLTVRAGELGDTLQPIAKEIVARQPVRVIISSTGHVDAESQFFQCPGEMIVVTAERVSLPEKITQNARVDHWQIDTHNNLRGLLEKLAAHGCNEVLVEAGATLAGAFVQADLFDELYIYMAPKLLGRKAKPLFDISLDKMVEQKSLTLMDTRQFGDDIRFVFQPDVMQG